MTVMRYVLAVAVSLALLPSATNAQTRWIPGITPPPQYDHPCKRNVYEFNVPRAQVNATCSRLSGHMVTMAGACSFPNKYGWVIVIPSDSPIRDVYRAHEIAHCNGWRH